MAADAEGGGQGAQRGVGGLTVDGAFVDADYKGTVVLAAHSGLG